MVYQCEDSTQERKEIWVLEDASKKIRAILGYRYAKPLSFEEETGKMILSYENKNEVHTC